MTAGIRKASAPPPWRVTSGEQDPGTVDRLLRLLPGWFGIESSIIEYVAKAQELPTYLAWPVRGSSDQDVDRQPVGVLLAARHFPGAAEIYLMAVEPAVHRLGPRAGAGGRSGRGRCATAPGQDARPVAARCWLRPDTAILRVHGLPAAGGDRQPVA